MKNISRIRFLCISRHQTAIHRHLRTDYALQNFLFTTNLTVQARNIRYMMSSQSYSNRYQNHNQSSHGDTIYALATGINTAISIIRVSGGKAYLVMRMLSKINFINNQNNKNGMERTRGNDEMERTRCNNEISHDQCLIDEMVEKNMQAEDWLTKEDLLKKYKISARKMHFHKFYNRKNEVIDEGTFSDNIQILCIIRQGLLVYFPSESSYNHQDIFQLHLHGSKAVVTAIFQELTSMGIRIAERGEFTRRAVQNGKMTINKAQAINDLIKSQSQFGRQVAINNLLGKNIDFVKQLRMKLMSILAKNEAYIDFQQDENDVSDNLFKETKKQSKEVVKLIQNALKNAQNFQRFKDGVIEQRIGQVIEQRITQVMSIWIVGKPNVGKSTLINALSCKEVSIVSEIPGTTRDPIEVSIFMKMKNRQQIRVNLIDTAGIHQMVSCTIEREGIRRAKHQIQNSHINLILIDIQDIKHHMQVQNQQILLSFQNQQEIQDKYFHPLQAANHAKEQKIMQEEEQKIKQEQEKMIKQEKEKKIKQEKDQGQIQTRLRKNIYLINKIDKIPKQYQLNPIKMIYKEQENEKQTKNLGQNEKQRKNLGQNEKQTKKQEYIMQISSKQQLNLNKISSMIEKVIQKQYSLYLNNKQQIFFTRKRYQFKLSECKSHLQKYLEEEQVDISCQWLRIAVKDLEEIIGEVQNQEMLDVLFSQFCIGK